MGVVAVSLVRMCLRLVMQFVLSVLVINSGLSHVVVHHSRFMSGRHLPIQSRITVAEIYSLAGQLQALVA